MRASIVAALLFLMASAPVHAKEILKEQYVWLPQSIKKGEVLPVLIVHEGAADPDLINLEQLAQTHRIAIVHAKHGGLLGGRDRGLQVNIRLALAEAARVYHPIGHAPWILGAFGKRGGPMTGMVYAGVARDIGLQGVVIVQPVIRVHRVDADKEPLPRQEGLRMLLVESAPTDESTVEEIVTDVATAGVTAKAEHLEAGAKGSTARVGEFLDTFAGQSVNGRAMLPPLAGKGDFETVETVSTDGLLLTADLYRAKDERAPVVLLFHQARSSRGEYRRIAMRLVRRGYNVLAIDQRSGDAWGGVDNESTKRAKAKNLAQKYIDARPDLDRGVSWARALGLKGKLAIVGSSYSSSLAIFVAADHADVSAVISFSPGDYLPPRGSILAAAKRLKKPALVVCPPREERQATQVFTAIASEHKQLYVQPKGVHGASTLDRSPTFDEAWKIFLDFLETHLK